MRQPFGYWSAFFWIRVCSPLDAGVLSFGCWCALLDVSLCSFSSITLWLSPRGQQAGPPFFLCSFALFPLFIQSDVTFLNDTAGLRSTILPLSIRPFLFLYFSFPYFSFRLSLHNSQANSLTAILFI